MVTLLNDVAERFDVKEKQHGRKALSLAKLASNGFPVPSGFALPAGFNSKDSAFVAERVLAEALLLDAPFGYAVRSSALLEDSPRLSFAGMFESILGVTLDELENAIAIVSLSHQNARAESYRSALQTQHFEVGMGVIVQVMLSPIIAGVVFTANPTGDPEHMLIESIMGLGELLMDGRVTPSVYEVDRRSFNLKSTSLASQTRLLQSRPFVGVVEIDRNIEHYPETFLNQVQIRQLTEVALRIEDLFGCPQDIEFAFDSAGLHILQSRPITGPAISSTVVNGSANA